MVGRQNHKNCYRKASAKLTQITLIFHSTQLLAMFFGSSSSSSAAGKWGSPTKATTRPLDDWVGLGCLSAVNLLVNGKVRTRVCRSQQRRQYSEIHKRRHHEQPTAQPMLMTEPQPQPSRVESSRVATAMTVVSCLCFLVGAGREAAKRKISVRY